MSETPNRAGVERSDVVLPCYVKVAAVRFSGYGGRHNDPSSIHKWVKPKKTARELKGMLVHIHLPPELPEREWNCRTKLVWCMTDEDVIRLTGNPGNGRHVVLCEHQLELD